MKPHSLSCSLFVAACAALLATNPTAAESPRERLSLDARWEFHLSIRFRAARASHCAVYFNGSRVHHNFCSYTSFYIEVSPMARWATTRLAGSEGGRGRKGDSCRRRSCGDGASPGDFPRRAAGTAGLLKGRPRQWTPIGRALARTPGRRSRAAPSCGDRLSGTSGRPARSCRPQEKRPRAKPRSPSSCGIRRPRERLGSPEGSPWSIRAR